MALRTRKPTFSICQTQDRYATQIVPASAAGLADHRLRGAAEQGGGRGERLRARLRHPPGRRASRRANTYEIMTAEDVGWSDQQDRSRQALGPHRRSSQRMKELGIELDSDDRLQQGLPALQGPGRQEGRDLRRGPARAGGAGSGRLAGAGGPGAWCTMRQAKRDLGERAFRFLGVEIEIGAEITRRIQGGRSRSTPPSRPLNRSPRAARSCCSTR